jgi:hypothetical protein
MTCLPRHLRSHETAGVVEGNEVAEVQEACLQQLLCRLRGAGSDRGCAHACANIAWMIWLMGPRRQRNNGHKACTGGCTTMKHREGAEENTGASRGGKYRGLSLLCRQCPRGSNQSDATCYSWLPCCWSCSPTLARAPSALQRLLQTASLWVHRTSRSSGQGRRYTQYPFLRTCVSILPNFRFSKPCLLPPQSKLRQHSAAVCKCAYRLSPSHQWNPTL